MTTISWSQTPMAGRGNGQWPGWQPSTGPHYADPMMEHEGRIAYLEATQHGFQAEVRLDIEKIRADQEQHYSVLMDLRESFMRHTGRSLAQIVRQRWDEIAGYLLIAAATAYANRGSLEDLALRVLGVHPDQ